MPRFMAPSCRQFTGSEPPASDPGRTADRDVRPTRSSRSGSCDTLWPDGRYCCAVVSTVASWVQAARVPGQAVEFAASAINLPGSKPFEAVSDQPPVVLPAFVLRGCARHFAAFASRPAGWPRSPARRVPPSAPRPSRLRLPLPGGRSAPGRRTAQPYRRVAGDWRGPVAPLFALGTATLAASSRYGPRLGLSSAPASRTPAVFGPLALDPGVVRCSSTAPPYSATGPTAYVAK